jgi:hypothetical protein
MLENGDRRGVLCLVKLYLGEDLYQVSLHGCLLDARHFTEQSWHERPEQARVGPADLFQCVAGAHADDLVGAEDALHQFRQPIRLAGRGIDHDGGIAQGARVATGQQRFDRTQAIAGQIVADIVPALIVHAGSPPSTVSYRLSGPRPGQ